MDNITHSLAGLLLAGTVVQLRSRELRTEPDDPTFATTAAVTGVVGANLPDIDVLWSAVLQGVGVYDDLLSLLHHRGYTHTVLAGLVFIPVLWLLASGFRRWQQRDTITSAREREADRRLLLLLSVVSVASHVTLDFTNDYGVHPLSPFVNAWYYGDTVFIIEPWLWVVAIPMILRVTERRLTRVVLWLVLLLGITLCWLVPYVSREAAVVVTAGVGLWTVLSRQVSRRAAPVVGLAAWVVVTSLFVTGTRTVRAAVASAQRVASAADGARLVDMVSTPSPANPVCARLVTIETTPESYRLTTAWGSALPGVVPASWCAQAVETDTTRGAATLPMVRATRQDSPSVDWQWTWQAPRADLAQLARENCRVSAWLRFVRAPFWVPQPDGSVRVGDLRYDRARVSVAAFTFPARPARCPRFAPPWIRPRQGVLAPDGAD